MNNSKITAERLLRKAIVYIRQSSPNQVLHHQESQRRQYALVDRARDLGFQQVIVITKIWGARDRDSSSVQDFSVWWPRCAAVK